MLSWVTVWDEVGGPEVWVSSANLRDALFFLAERALPPSGTGADFVLEIRVLDFGMMQ